MSKIIAHIALLIVAYQCHSQSNISIPELPDKKIEHSIILIGSTGYESKAQPLGDHLSRHLNEYIKGLPKSSSVVFLGDNIHPNGLPPIGDEDRQMAEEILADQLEIVDTYKGDTYFMPGNADWNNSSTHGDRYIRRQEEFIENYYGEKSTVKFVPGKACGGPKVKKVKKDLVFIFIDSEWWLRNNEYRAEENRDCKCKTRNDLIESLRKHVLKYRRDRIVLFVHHPLETLGRHSGTYDWEEHIFPLEQMVDDLYLPLPIIGSVYPAIKNIFGLRQDMSHPDYQLLKNEILSLITELELELIIVSGHDYGLQYFEKDNNHFILSGNSDPREKLKITRENIFNSNSTGYGIIRYYSNEEMWLDFVTVEDDPKRAQVIYRTQLFDDKKRLRNTDYDENSSIAYTGDTIASANTKYGGGGMKKFWFGEQYRDMWVTPIKVPKLDLSKVHGGLKPKKLGGGKSSISLRLEDASDREYVLRSVDKYYYRAFGQEYKDLRLFELVQEMVGAHCTYGPLMIPYLSRAADIYYVKPELYYVGHQPALKGYNQYMPEGMYWLQERTSVDDTPSESFGNALKIINYLELMQNIENKKTHLVDQKWLLKSRLFDFWIHDFDRHHDNWRWAAFEIGEFTIYRPIPRDRDMVFYNFEGVIAGFVSRYISRMLLPFRKKVQDVQYFTFSGMNVDNSFLNELTWTEWVPIIEQLQKRLTDSVIHQSITLLPPEVQHLVEEDFIKKLKYRRDHLKETAYEYYQLLYKEVVIVCSNNRDKVIIDHLPSEQVKVRHIVKRKKKEDLLKYERIFDPEITKKIRIYGLSESDEFIINGESVSSIDIRIIGGHGKDSLINKSNTGKVRLYDYPKDFEIKGKVKVEKTTDLYVNSYRRTGTKYNTWHYTANLGIAPDDGLWLGIGQVRNIEAFPHVPHKIQHRYSASIAPGSRRFFHFNYAGRYYNIIGSDVDLMMKLKIETPTYLNYFGLGNDRNIEKQDRKFNWVRMHHYRLQMGLAYAWNEDKVGLELAPFFDRRKVILQDGRVTSSEEYGFNDIDFETKNYIGLNVGVKMGYRDNKINPMDGFEVSVGLEGLREVSNHHTAGYFSIKVISYLPILRHPQITLANQIWYGLATGSPEFYQRPNLGHSSGLRGRRNQRFIGDRAFFHNIDLRMHILTTYNRIMPMRVGAVFGFDYGRVWVDAASSDNIHNSVSLGLSLELLHDIMIHPYYSISNDHNRINLQIGFRF